MPAPGAALCPQPAPAGCSACWMIRSKRFFNTFATLVTQSGSFERSEPSLELLPDGRMGKESPALTSTTVGRRHNLCERALKRAVLHRKNALFYRTLNGAQEGDLFMSLIHTCELCHANSFDYLTELQRHAQELAAIPASWMPWNYREMLGHAGV